MAADFDAICLCAAEHRPSVLSYQSHHIWPLGMGGPNISENRLWLCPTAHANVHELLRLMVSAMQPLSTSELTQLEDRPVPRYAAEVARQGFQRWLNRV